MPAARNVNMNDRHENGINNGHKNPDYAVDSVAIVDDLYRNEAAKKKEKEANQMENSVVATKSRDPQLWRDLVGFWFLGLCNNYGYVVMLSAAHDIIAKFDNSEDSDDDSLKENSRECHIMSTGAILLADIIPALFIKLCAPFLPFWINVRVFLAISLTVAGFLLVGFAEYQWMALFGVVCISLSSGLGETTLLGYSSRFNRNVVSTWSSGTGGAGVGGSLSYAALRTAGVSSLTTMLIMLVVPLIECIAFWVVLRKPRPPSSLPNSNSDLDGGLTVAETEQNNNSTADTPLVTLKEKMLYLIYLLRYMIPLSTVYFAEYFINQGLSELVYFQNISMDKATQYRWFNVVYQIGVFVSRSTVNLVSIDKIWLFPVFQLTNVVYFLVEVLLYVTPSIWIVYAIVFWEGLLGGGAYVNTFYKMSKVIPRSRRQFALAFVATSDAVGITLAGFLAMPIHNVICNTPAPHRL